MIMTILHHITHCIIPLFQVLRLFHFLVKFGYYGSDDIKSLLKPLINLLNGKNDKPFPPDTDKGMPSCSYHTYYFNSYYLDIGEWTEGQNVQAESCMVWPEVHSSI